MRILHDTLSPDDLKFLRYIADLHSRWIDDHEISKWKPGRRGTGYQTLDLREVLQPHKVQELSEPVLRQMIGDKNPAKWDMYLIHYPNGSSVDKHTDPAVFGLEHHRTNHLVTAGTFGGQLDIGNVHILLEPGEGVQFRPDLEEHEVTPVTGERLVFSVGCLV